MLRCAPVADLEKKKTFVNTDRIKTTKPRKRGFFHVSYTYNIACNAFILRFKAFSYFMVLYTNTTRKCLKINFRAITGCFCAMRESLPRSLHGITRRGWELERVTGWRWQGCRDHLNEKRRPAHHGRVAKVAKVGKVGKVGKVAIQPKLIESRGKVGRDIAI